ncbi:MAG: heme-binding protein [Gammaproteobacteria bacterium]|nr:heme-binding protein [Gammaproteobacteria bacterium]
MKQRTLRTLPATALLGLLCSAPLQAAETTIATSRFTLDTALKIAQSAIDACRKEGVQIAVTVVDRAGHPQVVLRDVLAMDLTLTISRQKAYTALSFNMPTSEIGKRFRDPYSVMKIEGLVASAGGLPITAAGALLGGVGVSGAPSGETDERCARAGVEAVSADLEMAL